MGLRISGLSHSYTPPHPTRSKLILDGERRTSSVLLKVRERDFIAIVSAPLGVLLPSLIWWKTSFSAVPHHPHLQKETYEWAVKMWPHWFDIILFCIVFSCTSPPSLCQAPGNQKKLLWTAGLILRAESITRSTTGSLHFMNHGIYPVTLAMSPITLIPKWPASEDVKGWRVC